MQFLDSAVSSTKSMISDVKALGTPKVKDGEGIAASDHKRSEHGADRLQTGARVRGRISRRERRSSKPRVDEAGQEARRSRRIAAGKVFDSADKKYDTKALDAARKKNPDCDTLS